MAGFQNPMYLSLLVLALPGIYLAVRNSDNLKRAVSLSRTLLIVLLVLAAASPFINAEEEIKKQPEIVVLKDSSASASILKEADLEFQDIKVREKVIASGNSSDLRQGILRNLKPNTAYLAISDFQSTSSLKGLGNQFQAENSTLNALKPEIEEESSVSIRGPSSTVPGALNSFTVTVESTTEVTKPTVTLDGQQVELEKQSDNSWSFTRTFEETGSHRLKAAINTSDEFRKNNVYYHALEVTEKPEILIVGQEGSLSRNLEEFFDVTRKDALPKDLSDYYAVIAKKDLSREPVTYVSRGNGLIYTGDYEDESMEVLPVKKIPETQQNKGAKIALAIDISEGTGGKCIRGTDSFCLERSAEGGSVKQSIKIAYNLVEKLPFNNRVGAVSYNDDAYLVEKPEPLSRNRKRLQSKISRLDPSGPSLHHHGLRGAAELLNGTGNIIMITDGKVGGLGQNQNSKGQTRQIASDLEVRLITVGVGEETDKNFLRDIARRGNGFYMDAKESGRLQFQFKAGGASGQTTPLVVVNPNHFITEGIELQSSSTFFDSVEPRTGATLLATGTNGKPFLTTWRYGLGKVAAFSGGDKDLSMISRVDPKLLTRTVSWAVGDPKRKREKWIRVENGRSPSNVDVRASYDIEGLKRQGNDLYTAELDPGRTGFHSFGDKTYSYNYNPEIEEIGYSQEMKEVVRSTGGQVYSPDEKKAIAEDLKRFSEKKVVTKKSLSAHFLLLALIVFLAEVGYRKMKGRR